MHPVECLVCDGIFHQNNMEAVRRYRRTEYHSGECCCSLVVCCVSLALCSDTCRLDLNSLTVCSSCCRLGKSGDVMGVELSLVHTRVKGSNSSETPSPLPHTLSKNVPSSALAVPRHSGGLGSKVESSHLFMSGENHSIVSWYSLKCLSLLPIDKCVF